VIHDAAIGLLGNTLVEAAVARFHVEDRDLTSLGRDYRQAAVGITQHQQRLGLLGNQHSIHGGNDLADGLCSAATRSVQEVIRLANAQVVKEDLVELVVVVLTRVHHNMLAILVQASQHTGKTNDFRPGTDHGHDFEFFHLGSGKKRI
jgi:hypothetical protein